MASTDPVLVVEPNAEDRLRVCATLERASFTVISTDEYRAAARILFAKRPRIVLLGAGSKESGAWALLVQIRELTDVPVVMMAPSEDERDIVRALRLGADDYVTKPLALPEVVARVEAIERRLRANEATGYFQAAGIALDTVAVEARINGKQLRLTPLEFRLLLAFVRHPKHVLSKEDLLRQAWTDGEDAPHSRVKPAIAGLRARFEAVGETCPIETVRGFGYRLRAAERPDSAVSEAVSEVRARARVRPDSRTRWPRPCAAPPG